MSRAAARLAVVVAVAVAVAAPAVAAGVAEVAVAEAARLEARAAALDGSADPDAVAREALGSARDALVAGDVGADEADALTRLPRRLTGRRLDAAAAAHALKAGARRLRRYAELAERPAPSVEDGARHRLREILDGREFDLREPEPGTLRALMIRLQRWLVRQLDRVARFFALEISVVHFVLWLAVAGLAILAIAGLARALDAASAARRPERPATIAPVEPAPDAAALIAAAERELRRGRAVRALALAESAAVAALRARGTFPSAPSLTDLEGVSILRLAGGSAVQAFERIATLHDRVVYGGREARPDEIGAAIAAARTLLPEGAA